MKKFKKLSIIGLLATTYLNGASLITSVTDGIFISDQVPYNAGETFLVQNGNNPTVLLSVYEKQGKFDVINVLPGSNERHLGKEGDILTILNVDKYPDIYKRAQTFKAPSPVTGRGRLDQNITTKNIVYASKAIEQAKTHQKPELILAPTPKPDHNPTLKAYSAEQNPYFDPLNASVNAVPKYYSPTPSIQKTKPHKILGVKPSINILVIEALPHEFVKGQKLNLKSTDGEMREFEVLKVNRKFTMLKGGNSSFTESDYLVGQTVEDYL
jgi:hypothetical protein